MESLKWQWRNVLRLARLLRPEQSAQDLINLVGPWWLFLHGVKREHRVSLWGGKGWFCPDFAIPHKKLAVEAKGGWKKNWQRDIAKEQVLKEFGWQVLWVSQKEMQDDPRGTRKRIRNFLKG